MHPGTSSFQNASVYPIAEFPRPAKVVVTAPAGSSFPFACETETVNEPPAPPNNTHENDSGALSIKAQPILCGGIVIFWNLLFTMVFSSLLLLLYLKKILFDF